MNATLYLHNLENFENISNVMATGLQNASCNFPQLPNTVKNVF